MEDPDQLPEEGHEEENLVKELIQGISDEVLEDIPKIDSSEEHLAETDLQDLITQLLSKIKKLEGRLSQLEKKPSGEMQFDRALKEYHRIMNQGREMAKDMLEQRKNDKTVYQTLNIVVRETKKRNIEYGVKGEIRMKRRGIRVDPKPFEDTEILKVPKAIKKALRG